jgi:hypothetical protein
VLPMTSGPSSSGTLKTTKTAVTAWQGHDDNECDNKALLAVAPSSLTHDIVLLRINGGAILE